MVRSITALSLIALAACQNGKLRLPGKRGPALSYSQYQSLEKGTQAKAILNAFGDAASNTLEQDGRIRGLTYACENAAGQVVQLRLVFDAGERLERWSLRTPEGKPAS